MSSDPVLSRHSLPVLPNDASSGEIPVYASEPPPAGAPSSILQRRVTLQELIDLRAFRDVCASFVDLYKIGIKIFDVDGTKLVDVRIGNGDWCGYIFSNPTGRQMCTSLVHRIKHHAYTELEGGQVVIETCFSGLRYVIMPIAYGGDALGRVVYGPFLPQDLEEPGETVHGFGEGFDPEKLWLYSAKIRRAPDETIGKILTNFRQVVDTIVFVAMKALMTQHLHIESVTASYNELATTNRALREALDKLKELDRLKSNFLAMISHELRTPLTSIIGYSEMLVEGMAGPLSPEQNEFAGTIKEKGESLLALIGSLLDLSKIESGTLRLQHSEVDLMELISSAHTSVVPQAQKKRIELSLSVDPTLPRIWADREKIGQAIVNLLANAVKFTQPGGTVRVRASTWVGSLRNSPEAGRFGAPEETFARIQVSDTGIGIPANKLEDIFKAFYQVDNSFTREHGGIGLGLAIVKRFVEAHGGEVRVESTERVGSTFTLLVPLHAHENRRVPAGLD